MHSRIFQISTQPIPEDKYVSEDEQLFADDDWVDYVSDIDDEERRESLDWLAKTSQGMLKVVDSQSLRYEGGVDKVLSRAIAQASEVLAKATPGTYGKTAWEVERLMRDPLRIEHKFYVDCGNLYAEDYGFSLALCEKLQGMQPGSLLYVGAVLDYHW